MARQSGKTTFVRDEAQREPALFSYLQRMLDDNGLRRQELFRRLVQSLIELADAEERTLLESLSNHIGTRGAAVPKGPELALDDDAGRNAEN